MEWNDSRGVILSWDETTRSIPGQKDSPGVVIYQDRMTPGSGSILGLKHYPGVVIYQDKMTPLGLLYPRKV